MINLFVININFYYKNILIFGFVEYFYFFLLFGVWFEIMFWGIISWEIFLSCMFWFVGYYSIK